MQCKLSFLGAGGGGTVLPRKKPLRPESSTNKRHMTSSLGIEPGPHWWEAHLASGCRLTSGYRLKKGCMPPNNLTRTKRQNSSNPKTASNGYGAVQFILVVHNWSFLLFRLKKKEDNDWFSRNTANNSESCTLRVTHITVFTDHALNLGLITRHVKTLCSPGLSLVFVQGW